MLLACCRTLAAQRITALVIPAIASALAAYSQTPPALQDTVIRSTTRLVEIHLAAWDNQGKRITDLQKKDLRILDDGTERSIVSFTIDGRCEKGRGTSFRAPNSTSRDNTGSNTDVDGYSAILLDWLNSPTAARLRGDDAVRKVLSTIPVRQDVAVYAFGTEPPNARFPLSVISDFGGNPADITTNLHDPMILPGPELTENGQAGGRGRRLSVEEQLFDWNTRIKDTLRALSYLADRMARLPGKKSLIWLTEGFPMILDGSVIPGAKRAEVVYLSEVNRILAKFNQLNITVHAVNTQGLAETVRGYPDTLREFAERTGGTVFLDRNDLDTGVQIAIEDLNLGYTLSFLAPEGAAPGMHRIKIRSTRPNVKLTHRESYEMPR